MANAREITETIAQGETFLLELRLPGEDLSDGAPYVETTIDMPADLFTVTVVDGDTIKVVSTQTDLIAPGRHMMRVWINWASGDIEKEVVLCVHVTVRGRLLPV